MGLTRSIVDSDAETLTALVSADGSSGGFIKDSERASNAEAQAQSSTTQVLTPANLAHGARTILRANLNGTNQTGATAGAYNKINFNTVSTDLRGWFDVTTNYRYTPLVAGYYLVNLRTAAASSVSESPQAVIYKNGVQAIFGLFIAGTLTGSEINSPAAGIIFCNGSTDYIEGFIYLPSGVTTIAGAVAKTGLDIALVGV